MIALAWIWHYAPSTNLASLDIAISSVFTWYLHQFIFISSCLQAEPNIYHLLCDLIMQGTDQFIKSYKTRSNCCIFFVLSFVHF